MSGTLLEISKFSLRCGLRVIIDAASLTINANEMVALVGESGSGKTLLARSIMRLFPSHELEILSGKILFHGLDLLSLPESQLRGLRGSCMGYIPQFSFTALNPIMRVGLQLIEAFLPTKERANPRERALSLLRRVGFTHPELIMLSLPHQLSGGMRQRVLIAMALMNSPQLLIADEPTTALDVTLQAEILTLLQELKDEYGLGVLFITHDLGLVARAADRVVILEQGKTIETGTTEDIFYHPQALYTKALLDSLSPYPAYPRRGSP